MDVDHALGTAAVEVQFHQHDPPCEGLDALRRRAAEGARVVRGRVRAHPYLATPGTGPVWMAEGDPTARTRLSPSPPVRIHDDMLPYRARRGVDPARAGCNQPVGRPSSTMLSGKFETVDVGADFRLDKFRWLLLREL